MGYLGLGYFARKYTTYAFATGMYMQHHLHRLFLVQVEKTA